MEDINLNNCQQCSHGIMCKFKPDAEDNAKAIYSAITPQDLYEKECKLRARWCVYYKKGVRE
jgi:hypothetical protein